MAEMKIVSLMDRMPVVKAIQAILKEALDASLQCRLASVAAQATDRQIPGIGCVTFDGNAELWWPDVDTCELASISPIMAADAAESAKFSGRGADGFAAGKEQIF